MINRIDMLRHRPQRGWDPVSVSWAREYADDAWKIDTAPLLDRLEADFGHFDDKKVLDLGGGPGHYSVAFARRGARVTWHDISRSYREIAMSRAEDANVEIDFSLGYLEEAAKFRSTQFDLVFCNLAWYYCADDRSFSRILYDIVKPGGSAYIDCNTAVFDKPSAERRIRHAINRATGIKIGHLYPPHGRLERLLRRFPTQDMWFDYSTPENDRIFFVKKL